MLEAEKHGEKGVRKEEELLVSTELKWSNNAN